MNMLYWGTRRFLTIIIAIQVFFALITGLAALGVDIPIIRPLLGFIYLTFVPGLLILRILKFRKLGGIETLLYSVGLSIALVMFTGFSMNMLYPPMGIARPISMLPLIITLTGIMAIFCAVTYMRERRDITIEDARHSLPLAELLSPPVLFLLLLPLLSALGAYYLANFYQNTTLLLVLIALIALIAVLVAFNRFIPQRLYPHWQ
ncbi:MAG: hypothetical protein Q8O55_07280 [Dehalococcoidales bacterium]|nr:hypothetical protein [Dehalococcoidales bacterium]